MDGPKSITPGKTYTYAFKISKRENGHNINTDIDWSVESGNIEILDTTLTLDEEYTSSVATIKFADNFETGTIKASSDAYNVESDPENSSYITYFVEKE